MRFPPGALLLLGLLSCARPDPRLTLDAYRQALQQQDATALAELSQTPPAPPAELAEALAADPSLSAETEARLSGAFEFETYAEAVTPEGARIRLLWTPAGWRVAEGGLDLADTPERALRSFFRAVETADWARILRLIPSQEQAPLTETARLQSRLTQLSARIERAREGLAQHPEARAVITQDQAYLDYEPGRSVRFVRENGRWRILDLE